MKSYSPNIQMKSIDEGIIDFHGTREVINKRSLEEIGFEIKAMLICDSRQRLSFWHVNKRNTTAPLARIILNV